MGRSDEMGCAIVNFYKFLSLSSLPDIRMQLKKEAKELGLLGTILLAPEGINCALAGPREALIRYIDFLETHLSFNVEGAKWSESDKPPFKRMEVKLKRWIIRFAEGDDPTIPRIETAARMPPKEVFEALSNKPEDFIVVDTRNDYETDAGMFEGAVRLPIKTFTQFPEAFLKEFADKKDKTILFYCTGGVRCEKVVPWAVDRGFAKATQIDGGILKYFEEYGSAHYQGGCFVFDDRLEVDIAEVNLQK